MNDNNSILNDIDISLDRGDSFIDPFSLLKVQNIKIDGNVNQWFNNIDIDSLINETADLDIDEFENLLIGNEFLLMDYEVKDLYLRFSWWMCRELIFSPVGIHSINIVDILKDQSKNIYVKIFIYSTNNAYKLAIALPNGTQIIIKFLDNTYIE